MPNSIPSNDENTNAAWKLRHLNGNEYGPYSWEQILSFATESRISRDSFLYHPSKTNGQWIRVDRIKSLVSLLPHLPHVASASLNDVEDFTQAQEAIEVFGLKPTTTKSSRAVSSSIIDVLDFSFTKYAMPSVIKVLWFMYVVLWVLIDGFFLMVSGTVLYYSFSSDPAGFIQNHLVSVILFVPLFVAYKVFTLLLGRLILETAMVLFDIRRLLAERSS